MDTTGGVPTIPGEVISFLRAALAEDAPHGDVTTAATIPPSHRSTASITAKEAFVLAGMPFAREVFALADPAVEFAALVPEGGRVAPGDLLATATGSTHALLLAERLALNVLQRLSGTATLTARFVAEVAGTSAAIVDTRKTSPGMRFMQKYAVRMGGGRNHRFGLSDGILIKDNHIAAAGGIAPAVERARAVGHHLLKIEVECATLDHVREALAARADVIMLDNMPTAAMREAVALVADRAMVEASGNVSLSTVRSIAETGVHLISVGALTHSAPSADISLSLVPA